MVNSSCPSLAVQALLQSLSHGQCCSLSTLSHDSQLPHLAVKHYLDSLSQFGLALQQVDETHYQLSKPFEPLDASLIQQQLTPNLVDKVKSIDVFTLIDSTNRYLLENAYNGQVCLAEYQSAGRGQHGRTWLAPWGGSLCMSMSYHYRQAPVLSGLSLALAIAVAQCLRSLGAAVQVKWPNDIYWQGRKLAGLLIETRRLTQRCELVFGLGLNCHLPNDIAIGQPWTDLETALTEQAVPNRNTLAASLLNACWPVLQHFPQTGLSPYLPQWLSLDALYQQSVQVITPLETIQGRACGIDQYGALQVQVGGQRRCYQWGEVSIRL